MKQFLLQCLLWKPYFVLLRNNNNNKTFPSLWDSNYLGMVHGRKWSQACWEVQSWAARSAEIPPENRHLEKSVFLLNSFSPLFFFFLIVDGLRPGYSLCFHLMVSCKSMAGFIFQMMCNDVQDSTHNRQ